MADEYPAQLPAEPPPPPSKPDKQWHPAHDYPPEGVIVEAEVELGGTQNCLHVDGVWRVKPPGDTSPSGLLRGASVHRWRHLKDKD